MAEEITSAKLLQDYENIRRREVELMTQLLDVLPKIDSLDEQRVGQVRDAMFHADHPYMMVFVGPFNSGKSSLVNALVGEEELLKIGPTPVTDRIAILRYGDSAQTMGSMGSVDTVFSPSLLLKKVSFVDTPGLESVFREHEETTRKFLHRADVVLLVMLATQAMTQSNLQYLQTFKEYGKKVILVINQCDLLSDEERETVRQYVQEQSRDKLGFIPEIWMVSAKWGKEAREGAELNAELWKKSGLDNFEAYIEKQLNDANRLRQKLQTPLQIAQNAQQSALEAVKKNQATFDQYRNITENIERQLDSQKRDLQKTVRDINDEVETRFKTTIDRSREALLDVFQLANALRALGSGILELTVILPRLFNRLSRNKTSVIAKAFQQYKVYEPIDELPSISDKLAPRLEGQDMKDIADLVAYGQRESENLPLQMRSKMIGVIQTPSKYDREYLMGLRQPLLKLEEQAKILETEKIEQERRNTIIYLAVWEIICVLLMVVVVSAWSAIATTNDFPAEWIAWVAIIIAGLAGFLFLPIRGRLIHRQFASRLLKIQAQYIETLTVASDKQIEYSLQLRRDTISPLTRLVDAQATTQDKQLTQLQRTEQSIVKIEQDLNALGKRKILGMTL